MIIIRKIILGLSVISFFNNFSQGKPNIIWLVCEDQSLFFSAYGDSTAYTPNLDNLAENSSIYINFYAVSPVCAPSRSSIITGMYPTTIGTHNMRAYKKNISINKKTKLPVYSPVPKRKVQFFTEILRANGYYCSNNAKEDYNMEKSPLAWDESNKNAHWRNREKNQPFFSVFNFNITHESRIWGNYKQHSIEDINKVVLPPFYPKNDIIKNDFVTNYKNIEKLDNQIGEIISQLKEDGLYEETIIFFYSDHGGPFPRYKRSIYDTGLNCPLIIKWINKNETERNNQMISFIDLAPTVLDICDLEIPLNMEGTSFYNKNNRKFIYAATDRFDEFTDKRRCIRDKNYKLILNGDTNSSIMKPISYRKNMNTMKVLDSLNKKNSLNISMSEWFKNSKSKYELFDIINDPYELNNLYKEIENNEYYKQIFDKLNTKLLKWIESSDFGELSEAEMIQKFLPYGNKPNLNEPSIKEIKNGIIIHSNNLNYSIGWRNYGEKKWKIYNENEAIKPKSNFEIIIFSPGFKSIYKSFSL